MTTITEPTTAEWIDHLVPQELRAEGAELIEAVNAWRDSILPLMHRIRRFFEADTALYNRVTADLEAAMTKEDVYEASDGLGHVLGTLSHVLELNALLSNMGFDPDRLPGGIWGEVQD